MYWFSSETASRRMPLQKPEPHQGSFISGKFLICFGGLVSFIYRVSLWVFGQHCPTKLLEILGSGARSFCEVCLLMNRKESWDEVRPVSLCQVLQIGPVIQHAEMTLEQPIQEVCFPCNAEAHGARRICEVCTSVIWWLLMVILTIDDTSAELTLKLEFTSTGPVGGLNIVDYTLAATFTN